MVRCTSHSTQGKAPDSCLPCMWSITGSGSHGVWETGHLKIPSLALLSSAELKEINLTSSVWLSNFSYHSHQTPLAEKMLPHLFPHLGKSSFPQLFNHSTLSSSQEFLQFFGQTFSHTAIPPSMCRYKPFNIPSHTSNKPTHQDIPSHHLWLCWLVQRCRTYSLQSTFS